MGHNLSLMPSPIINGLCLSERILNVILVCRHTFWVGTHSWFGSAQISSGRYIHGSGPTLTTQVLSLWYGNCIHWVDTR